MKKILVVDDESVSLTMTEHILSEKYDVFCASSGPEAISIFEKKKPDMVLSDLRMPGMSGLELQKKLNKKTGKLIPFMFMTADTAEETESLGFENGALDFVRKPFRPDVLLRRVGNILRAVDMRRAAISDPMTGLLNKSSSKAAIGELCGNCAGILMVVDLDSFKSVNDIYGHAAGDRILVRFSEILQAVVRSSDIIGRLGGDEFIVFCRDVKEEIVIDKKSRFINRCILEAAKEFLGEDCAIPLGASIGCALSPADGTDFQTLFDKADKALYEVKRNGKHGFHFFSAQDSAMNAKEGSSLSDAMQILKERAQERGAYPVPLESFRTIYRFLVRLYANYGTLSWLITLSLKNENGSGILESESSLFFDALRSSLRQSDVITESSRGQFLLILMHTEQENIKMILERVEHTWRAMGGTLALSTEITQIS